MLLSEVRLSAALLEHTNWHATYTPFHTFVLPHADAHVLCALLLIFKYSLLLCVYVYGYYVHTHILAYVIFSKFKNFWASASQMVECWPAAQLSHNTRAYTYVHIYACIKISRYFFIQYNYKYVQRAVPSQILLQIFLSSSIKLGSRLPGHSVRLDNYCCTIETTRNFEWNPLAALGKYTYIDIFDMIYIDTLMCCVCVEAKQKML